MDLIPRQDKQRAQYVLQENLAPQRLERFHARLAFIWLLTPLVKHALLA